ncbi:unnamed protein product [Meganyctiphanes norvegica]|uniref:Uncharacterized protein n=1 Tax=Meganyctiphanes norvegica TaxID=48144 RepID=A0AAV2Q6C9_MEGNR
MMRDLSGVKYCAAPRPSTTAAMIDVQRNRRSNKPQMERRRRERINQCLNELKTLVLTAQKKDPSRYSKLEKADILEMTVRHIQNIHQQEIQDTGQHQQNKYYAGYSKCASEVTSFLEGLPDIPNGLRKRLTSHLNAPTVINSARISPKIVQLDSNKVPNATSSNISKTSPQYVPCSSPEVRNPIFFSQSLLSIKFPLSCKIGLPGSPPAQAASPETFENPNSPESAHEVSSVDLKSSGSHSTYQRTYNTNRNYVQSGDSTMNKNTTPSAESISNHINHQELPLNLAVHRSSSEFPNEQKISIKSSLGHSVKEVRYIPYAQPERVQNTSHWRPW